MIVLGADHKKIFTTWWQCAETTQVPFFIFPKVIKSSVSLAVACVSLVNDIGEHIGHESWRLKQSGQSRLFI